MDQVSVEFLNDRRIWTALPMASDQSVVMSAIARSDTLDFTIGAQRTVNVKAMQQTNQITGRCRPLRLYLYNLDTNVTRLWFFEDDNGTMSYSSFLTFQINARATLKCHLPQWHAFDDDAGICFSIDMLAQTQTSTQTNRVRRISSIEVQRQPSVPIAIAEQSDDEHDDEDVPDDFKCPITMLLFKTPVIAADGHTYESHAIQKWLAKKNTSPLHGAPMGSALLADN